MPLLRTYIILIAMLLIASSSLAQTDFYNRSKMLVVFGNTELYIKGSYISDYDPNNPITGNAEIICEGTIVIEGDLINLAPNQVFEADSGTIVFAGSGTQRIIGDTVHLHHVEVDITNGQLEVMVETSVSGKMTFTNGNVELVGGNIDLADNGFLFNEREDARIYGTGGVVKATRGEFLGMSDNVAGLGLYLDTFVTASYIERGHGEQVNAGDGGILRYYRIAPFVGDMGEMSFEYFDAELNGLDKSELMIWKSEDDIQWRRDSGMVDTVLKEVSTVLSPRIHYGVFTLAEDACDNPPIVNIGPDTIYLCAGDTLPLGMNLLVGMDYLWNTGDTTYAIAITTGGKYWGRTTTLQGCYASDTVVVIVQPYPIANFTYSLTGACLGQQMAFVDASSIALGSIESHSWDFGDATITTDTSSTASPSYLYPAVGNYYVTLKVISGVGCMDSLVSVLPVPIKPLPAVDFTFADTCDGVGIQFQNTTTISSGGIANYNWSFGDGSTSITTSPSHLYSGPATYSVRLIARSSGNCRDSTDHAVQVFPNPTAVFSFGRECAGVPISFTNLSAGAANYSWGFGDGGVSTSASPAHAYSLPGQYTATLLATSTQGCTDQASQSVQVDTIPDADFSFTSVCDGSAASFTNLTTSQSAGMSYLWSFGDGGTATTINPQHLYPGSGTYLVQLTATSGQGCVNSTSTSITIMPKPVANFVVIEQCVGTVTTFNNTSSILFGTLSYNWNFGDGGISSATSPNHTYISSGNFNTTLIATSNQGCVDTAIQVVESYARPVVNLGGSISTCGSQYTFDAQNAGSTYLWGNNSTNRYFTAYVNGNYSVLVTNANGCTASASANLVLNHVADPGLNNDTIVCDSISYDLYQPGATYTWSNGGTLPTNTIATSGSCWVHIIDQNSCHAYDTVLITVNASPIVNLGPDTAICAGETLSLNAQNPGSNYLWSTGAAMQVINVQNANSYWVSVTNAASCTTVDNITLGINPNPIIPFDTAMTSCGGMLLDAQNPTAAYLWSDASTNQTLWVSQSGNYSLEVTSTDGCVSFRQTAITVNPVPSVNLGNDVTLCNGETHLMNLAAPNSSYLWSDGSTSSANSVGTSGIFWGQVTNSFSCSARDSIEVIVDAPINLNLGPDQTLCNFSGISLDGGNAATHSWYFNDVLSGTNRIFLATQPGEIVLTVVSSLGCSETDSLTLGQSSATLTADFLVDTDIEPGIPTQFVQVSFPDPIVSQFWYFGDGAISTDAHPVHIYYFEDTMQVTLIASNGFCTDTVTKPVRVGSNKLDGPEVEFADEEDDQVQIVESKLFPNPNNGTFTIEVTLNKPAIMSLILADTQGKILANEQFDTQDFKHLFDYSFAESGIYFVSIQAGKNRKVLKFIKLD